MSGCGGGARLYALLASLDYPGLAGLSPEGLDWVWEQEGCHQFLSWLVNSLGPDQLISTQDLATYSALPPTSQLAEPLLSAALATCASQDGELSERELEQAVAELEEELELQEECRDVLEEVRDKVAAQAAREAAVVGREAPLMERVKRGERARQEELLLANTKYNAALAKLGRVAQEAGELCRELPSGQQAALPLFVSGLQLDPLLEADRQLEQQLQELLAIWFDGEGDGAGSLRGRNRAEWVQLENEVARLRFSFCQAEQQRVEREAVLAGGQAVLRLLSSSRPGPGPASLPRPTQSVDQLKAEAANLIEQIAEGHCQRILVADYSMKERRNKRVIERLQWIVDILLEQNAKMEVLSLLINREKKDGAMMVELFESIVKNMNEEKDQMERFQIAMKTLAEQKTESNLIPAGDSVMVRVHKILLNHGLVGPLATYSEVNTAISNLKVKEMNLEKNIDNLKNSHKEELESTLNNCLKIMNLMNISDTGTASSVQLVPRNIRTASNSLDRDVGEKGQELKDILGKWRKDVEELKAKPDLAMRRNVWVDFITKPAVLVANVKNLEIKVKK